MIYLLILVRGLLAVTLVACNVRQIALGHIGWGFVVAFLINVLWWSNSSKDRPDVPWAAIVYGLGGGCGTVLGYHIAEWLP